MGYSDDKIRQLCREALAEGWTHFKVKVGARPDDDRAAVGLVREEIGPDRNLMIDANQRWDVSEAIDARARARAIQSALDRGADEPDDVLGHATIAKRVRADWRGDRASTHEPDHLQTAPAGARRSTSARSTAAGSAA